MRSHGLFMQMLSARERDRAAKMLFGNTGVGRTLSEVERMVRPLFNVSRR